MKWSQVDFLGKTIHVISPHKGRLDAKIMSDTPLII
jgi:hypothetical protein